MSLLARLAGLLTSPPPTDTRLLTARLRATAPDNDCARSDIEEAALRAGGNPLAIRTRNKFDQVLATPWARHARLAFARRSRSGPFCPRGFDPSDYCGCCHRHSGLPRWTGLQDLRGPEADAVDRSVEFGRRPALDISVNLNDPARVREKVWNVGNPALGECRGATVVGQSVVCRISAIPCRLERIASVSMSDS